MYFGFIFRVPDVKMTSLCNEQHLNQSSKLCAKTPRYVRCHSGGLASLEPDRGPGFGSLAFDRGPEARVSTVEASDGRRTAVGDSPLLPRIGASRILLGPFCGRRRCLETTSMHSAASGRRSESICMQRSIRSTMSWGASSGTLQGS